MGKTCDLINESFTKKYSGLSEEVLDEKIPKDLARAYQRTSGSGDGVNYYNQSGNRRYSGATTDYEKANYTEITPEQAKEMKKNGEDLSKLRIVMRQYYGDSRDTMYLTFNSDGTPKHHTGPNYGIADKEGRLYVKRTGTEERDSRKIPFNWICDNAMKIYVTDEDTSNISPEKLKRRDINNSDKDTYQARYKNYQNQLRIGHTWGIRDAKNDIARSEKRLAQLDKKLADGKISKDDYDWEVAETKRNLDQHKTRLKRHRNDVRDAFHSWNDYEANHEFSRKVAEFKQLKYDLNRTEQDLVDTQNRYNSIVQQGANAPEYEYTRQKIDNLRSTIAKYMSDLRKLEKELSQNKISSDISDYSQKVSDVQAKRDDLRNKIDTMLHRNK